MSGRRWTATCCTYVRAQIEKVGASSRCRPSAHGTTASARSVRRRNASSARPRTSKALEIRVPRAPMLPIAHSRHSMPALDRRSTSTSSIRRAAEQAWWKARKIRWPIIATAQLYEVQKSISLTSHVWDAYWILNGNRRACGKNFPPTCARSSRANSRRRSMLQLRAVRAEAERVAAHGPEERRASRSSKSRPPARRSAARCCNDEFLQRLESQ